MNNIKLNVENEIAYVTIDRPKALNALNTETLKELNETFNDIRSRKDVKVLILTGGGEKSFVAGADISEMVNSNSQQARDMSLLAYETFNMLEEMPQVTIAAVNGFALGGGCEISMACDIRIASKNARFGQPEVGLGIIPGFGGTQRLPRLVGKGIAKELIFTTDSIKADEAYRIGLVNHVVEKEELIDYCTQMAEKIKAQASYAVTLAKQAINLGLESDLHTGIQLEANTFASTFDTHDKKEGMTAFLEKRKADLKDF
ncbi:enoyl-CoA hydratase/isomerase family protein [Anaerococcus sp. AGMB00486]|uniref:Enoyl-CoA hydratase/isomerase family protein n=2 Tax=Anaerococcus TaxID=165779 RepID=A0ABX2N9H0_9FIRM|nr:MULTISPECIES: enoyl-CoA hydratase-related protein [Anaerococcus]MDY3006150.1 enoyl-CoA hydratase-related protein [Anaerococcus porci]MSS78484.1 enoyl-CoA hydratase/isomerase family protein [Anaerococcus porci]NVF11340.1 enoyl-CoA hydratase/isomerase family protein [Anaerococcus faecalis]